MLAALIAPNGGSATVDGYALGRDDQNIRRSVGILTESPGLYDRLTAEQNLVFFAQLYEVPEKRAKEQAEYYLRVMDLWDKRDLKVGGFSKGMRQKLAITRAFMHNPPTVFLDEPTSGLDPEAARMVREFIKELRTEGHTIFLTTHNLTEADDLCDVVAVFRTRLIQQGTPAQLRSSLFGTGTLVRVLGDAGRWVTTAKALPFVHSASAQDGALQVQLDDPDNQNPELVRTLAEAGVPIKYVEQVTHSLEDVYLQLLDESENGQGQEQKA
jgi:ABC-2 type transport system ATP-binding protein